MSSRDALAHIIKPYTEPNRHYHDIGHIARMLKDARHYGILESASPLYHAILFHDIVYNAEDTASGNNERLSSLAFAKWWEDQPVDWEYATYGHCYDVITMINATAHHFDKTTFESEQVNQILDLDLMAFTDDYVVFKQTQKRIDAEFLAYFPETFVYKKRFEFLKNVYENKLLQFRILPDKDDLTKKAYENIRVLLLNMELHLKGNNEVE